MTGSWGGAEITQEKVLHHIILSFICNHKQLQELQHLHIREDFLLLTVI